MEPIATDLAIACALLCVVLSIVTWHWRRRRLYEQASKFEGPPVLPVVGNALLLAGGYEAILKSFAELTKSYPSPFRFWFCHRLFIVVYDPEQLKTILMSPKTIEKSSMYHVFRPMAPMGLVAAPASIWRVHRTKIDRTFNSKIINGFVDAFAVQSQILANKLEQNLYGPEFEVYRLVALTSINMLWETVMGVEIGAPTNSSSDYLSATEVLAKTTTVRMFSPWLRRDFIFNNTQHGKDQQRAFKIVCEFTDSVIEAKQRELQYRSQLKTAIIEDDAHVRVPRRTAFLDSLLELSHERDKWSKEELRDEVSTMMAAGYSTVSNENTFIMLMLATHPDVQEKVYQELYEIYGDADIDERPVTREDLRRMNYLDRVIKETTRLFPAVPMFARKVTDDLKIGEHTLPKGSEVCVNVLEVHRSEKYWLDPLKFDPDRFLPEEVAKRHPYSYLTFSAGPRNCVGIKYALMAMKTLQATILRRYILKKDDIVPVKDIRLTMEIVLKPVDPIAIRIEPRIIKP